MAVVALKKYQAIWGGVDHATRNAQVRFWTTAAAVTAFATDVTASGDITDIFDAIGELSLDTNSLRRASVLNDAPSLSSLAPIDENAVNSAKLLVLLKDLTNNGKYSMQIPARNGAHYASSRGLVEIGIGLRTTQINDLITSLEGGSVSEDGNAVSVYQIRVIGKGTAA